MSKIYLTDTNGGAKFRAKSREAKAKINDMLYMLETLGVPLDSFSSRGRERLAMAVLAVAQLGPESEWSQAKDRSHGIKMKSRDIIEYINEHYSENISPGSYDDIRRKDLKLPVEDGFVARSDPDAARNAPTRGYCLPEDHAAVIRLFGTDRWAAAAKLLLGEKKTLQERLARERELAMMPVALPGGEELKLTPGEHNELQKAIIEQFLPRYGFNAQVLYVGDAADKFLLIDKARLEAINFFELSHGELPDIVALSDEKGWLYLIEAVHSFGAIDPMRHLQLEKLTKKCHYPCVYVTAFLDRETFKHWVTAISWETEVWIAESPDHLIHFNGDKFLGPYRSD